MEKCKLCELGERVDADCLSYTRGGYMYIPVKDGKTDLLIVGNRIVEMLFAITCCPLCGRAVNSSKKRNITALIDGKPKVINFSKGMSTRRYSDEQSNINGSPNP